MTDQPIYPRLSMDMQEKVHTMASHLEIHAPFHMALDPEQALSMAGALRKSAEVADMNADMYNSAVEALEHVEIEYRYVIDQKHKLIGLAKSISVLLALGALVGVLNWLG